MFCLVFGDLGPVEKEVHWKSFTAHLEFREPGNNVPCEVDGILLDVGKRVWVGLIVRPAFGWARLVSNADGQLPYFSTSPTHHLRSIKIRDFSDPPLPLSWTSAHYQPIVATSNCSPHNASSNAASQKPPAHTNNL